MNSIDSPFDTCLACGGHYAYFGTRLTYEYHRCHSCKTLQLSPLPTSDFLEQAYSEQYSQAGHYANDPDQSHWNNAPFYQAVAETVQSWAPKNGKILDVGCGWGGLGRYLDPSRYVGIDYSNEMAAYAQGQGFQVKQAGLEVFQGGGSRFTAIVCLSLFEHLIDFGRFFQNIRKLLLPEGVLIILSPTASFAYCVGRFYQIWNKTTNLPEFYQLFCPPWHTVLFSLKGIEQLLRNQGFRIADVRPSPCGRAKGTLGILKGCGTWVGYAGFSLFGKYWPFVLSHVIICKLSRE